MSRQLRNTQRKTDQLVYTDKSPDARALMQRVLTFDSCGWHGAECGVQHVSRVRRFVCVLHVPAQKWEKPHLSHIYFSAWISCSEENLTRLLIHVYLGYLKCNHNESDCLTQPVWLCCSFVVQLTPVPLTSPSSCWVYLRGVTSCHFLSHVICLVSWSALVCFFLFLQYLLVFLVLYLSWISFFKIKLAFCFALYNPNQLSQALGHGCELVYISCIYLFSFLLRSIILKL